MLGVCFVKTRHMHLCAHACLSRAIAQMISIFLEAVASIPLGNVNVLNLVAFLRTYHPREAENFVSSHLWVYFALSSSWAFANFGPSDASFNFTIFIALLRFSEFQFCEFTVIFHSLARLHLSKHRMCFRKMSQFYKHKDNVL